MYQVVVKYTTGDTDRRDPDIYEEILTTKEDREEANNFAQVFLKYVETEQEYDYSYGKEREEGNRKLKDLSDELIKLGLEQKRIYNGHILCSCLGYFETIEQILVREQPKPEEKPLFFTWSRF